MVTMRIKRQSSKSCAEVLADRLVAMPSLTVIAVVPVMLTFFATAPHRYEVTEIDVIVTGEP